MNEKLRAIIEDFCVSAGLQASALEEWASDLGWPGAKEIELLQHIRFGSHRLAGTSRSMGFEPLGAMLLALETRVRACLDDPAALSIARTEIAAGCASVVAACDALRPRDSHLWSAPANDDNEERARARR